MTRYLIVCILSFCITLAVTAQTHEVDSLFKAAETADSVGNYTEAIRLGTDALRIVENKSGKADTLYAKRLITLATFYYNLGNHSEALQLSMDALQIYKKEVGEKNLNYASCLNFVAWYYFMLDNYYEAIRIGTEALQLHEKIVGKEHPDYASSLVILACSYSGLRNYPEAIRLRTEALRIQENTGGRESRDCAASLHNLAVYYSNLGNYSEAARLGTEALQITEKVLGKNHPEYAECLNILITYYKQLKNDSEVLRLYAEALSVKKNKGIDNENVAESLSTLTYYYYSHGNYTEAVRLGTEALQIYENILSSTDSAYTACLYALAISYGELGNYSESIRLCSRALRIIKNTKGMENLEYAQCINCLARDYYDLGNYFEASKLCAEGLQIIEMISGKEDPIYALYLNSLAMCYSALGNNTEAVHLVTKALHILEKTKGRVHRDYAMCLNTLTGCYASMGNYLEASQRYNEILQILEKLGKKDQYYATSLNNLSACYTELGNYSEATRLSTEALQIREKVLGREHPDYILNISYLFSCYEHQNAFNQCQSLIIEEFSLRQNYTLRLSQGLSKTDRESYWNNEKFYFENRYPGLAYKYNSAVFSSIAYNSALLYKGFLLGAEIETRKIIEESGDSALVSLYDDMSSNQQILSRQLEKPTSERVVNTDSLGRVISWQERELASKSTAYGSLVANMSVEWKDVQRKLRKNDIAVEFLSFQLNDDSCMYIVLTLKDGYESPKMIPLFEEKQLKAIDKNLYHEGANIYDLVWKPLEKELEGITNVYFSPSGELYNINIEVLPEIAGITDSRRYYRLSSTRELALTRVDNNKQNASAVVYGGLRYYCAKDSLITDSRKYPRSKKRSIEDFDLSADSIQLRSGYGYLEGTLLEAQKVDSSAVSAKMKSSLYTNFSGTEASFKALDGQGKQLIHIATHGFYYMEKDSVRMREKGFRMLQDESRRRYVEDKALTRSGLLFAGCNNILGGDTITLPEDVDDGILYAKEIARLDLRGLDLLTLSACQTGLGDITGEGVFGLQRAFKKAGAQSILMSLWKVDDDATQMFMTRFYENYLIKKMLKSEALLDAQKYLRSKNEKDWAAFILLDAI